jgi:hypothetical protein
MRKWRGATRSAVGFRLKKCLKKHSGMQWNFDHAFVLFSPWRSRKLKIDQQFERCNGTPAAGGPKAFFRAYTM